SRAEGAGLRGGRPGGRARHRTGLATGARGWADGPVLVGPAVLRPLGGRLLQAVRRRRLPVGPFRRGAARRRLRRSGLRELGRDDRWIRELGPFRRRWERLRRRHELRRRGLWWRWRRRRRRLLVAGRGLESPTASRQTEGRASPPLLYDGADKRRLSGDF